LLVLCVHAKASISRGFSPPPPLSLLPSPLSLPLRRDKATDPAALSSLPHKGRERKRARYRRKREKIKASKEEQAVKRLRREGREKRRE
jgi:hypothetical protein